MSDEKIYDYSMISTFQTCRRKYYWQYIRHLRPQIKGAALEFGGAIHDALDIFYSNPDRDAGIVQAVAHFQKNYKTPEGDTLRTVENGVKMLTWYSVKYKGERMKVQGKPEEGFVFFIGDVLFGGRLDLPVEWDGQLWIMEHKTTSRLTYDYFAQFELDKQPTGYIIALEEFTGRKCAGAIINAMEPWVELKRPTAKSKKPEDHFLRKPIVRSDMLKERFRYNVQAIVRDIRWCEENDEFQEAEKKEVCFYYNRPCPYLSLCQFGADERIIKRDYVIEKWEPYKTAPRKERV
jgi:hypothetical protein